MDLKDITAFLKVVNTTNNIINGKPAKRRKPSNKRIFKKSLNISGSWWKL